MKNTPYIVNPSIVNPDIVNPSIANPDTVNPDIVNPDIVNNVNSDIVNPDTVHNVGEEYTISSRYYDDFAVDSFERHSNPPQAAIPIRPQARFPDIDPPYIGG